MWLTFRTLLNGAFRDRVSLVWAIAFPLAILVGLGIAFPSDAYRQQLLMGVLAVSGISFAMMGTGFEIMRQRRKGVYKLLKATPFKISSFITALTLGRGVVTLLSTVLVFVIGSLSFHLTFSSKAILLMVPVWLVGLLCFTFLGVVVGNLGSNETHVAGMNNLITLPMMFASNMFYSLDKAPLAVRIFNEVMPLGHFMDALKAAVSGDFAAMIPPMLILLGTTVLTLVLAIVTFRWDPNAPLRLPGFNRSISAARS